MRFDGFTSGFYSFPSLDAASQMTMNYYPDLVEGSLPSSGVPQGGEKARKVLTPTPGLALYGTLPTSPCRGLWPGENRLFGAWGSHLYEVLGPSSFTDFGSIGLDSNPVQIIPNGTGNQLYVVSAGNAYYTTGAAAQQCQFSSQLYDLAIDATTGRLTGDVGGIFDATDVGKTVQITGGTGFLVQSDIITAVDTNGMATGTTSWGTAGSTGGSGVEWLGTFVEAIMGAFLDGSFFAVQPNSGVVYYSAIDDATSWDALQYFTKEAYPDAIAACIADHEQLYLSGALESTEVWADTGNANNPYQRNPSYFMHIGCGAPYSLCRLSSGVAWIGGDVRRGERVAFSAVGYVPARVSTAAIEKAWAAYATVEDAVSYSIIQDGHEFWVIHFPTGNATWVYDATLGEWHQRGWWNGTGWDRQRGAFHACVGIDTLDEVHYVGDWQNGNLYTMARTSPQDNGVAIHRRRRAPHLSNENKRRFYSLVELDCDTGKADIEGAAPRVRWLRCGAGRDRVYQIDDDGAGNLALSYSDDRCLSFTVRTAIGVASAAAAIAIVAMYLEFTEGTG